MGDSGRKRFIVEPHSPYHLHPSEGHGVMMVAFDGKNYDLWEMTVRTILKGKNKLGFIYETLTRPKDNDKDEFLECQAWDMANSMLCSWLFNFMDLELRMTIAYFDTTKILWDDLRKRYAIASTLKIHQLKANITN